jgi:hypothetical protein
LKEITQLKRAKQEVLDSIPKLLEETLAKHKVEIEQMNLKLENYRTAFSKKSAESLEFQQRIREIAEQNYQLEARN